METEYGLVIVKYKCPNCSEHSEDYPKASIYKNGYVMTCPFCEVKFRMKAMT